MSVRALVQEQIAWWRAEGWPPARALEALGVAADNAAGGSWGDVETLAVLKWGELEGTGPAQVQTLPARARLLVQTRLRRIDRLEAELQRGASFMRAWSARDQARRALDARPGATTEREVAKAR